MDESRSGHSIGIVENPLYAEEEEGHKYSDLVAKEKEAEVCIVFHNYSSHVHYSDSKHC